MKTLLEQSLLPTTITLTKHNAWRGSLGAVSVLSEAFDIYLLIPENNIKEGELEDWLSAGQILQCFRKFIKIDENIKESLLANTINVTITSDNKLAHLLNETERVYLLTKKIDNIQDGILRTNKWKEIVRDISLFAF